MKKLILPTISIKKYGGKQVAIVKGKIVASGHDAATILKDVKKQLPHTTWQDILLVSVPKGLTVVYRSGIL